MSAPKQQAAPIQRAPAQVASRMEEVVEKPIELVTADTDVKKKKKKASTSGTSQLNTNLGITTDSKPSGVNYQA